MNIGVAKRAKGNSKGALEEYVEACRIRACTGTLETSSGAQLLNCVGAVKCDCGDLAGALDAYSEARRIRERTGTLETTDGALLLRNIEVTQRRLAPVRT